MVYLDRFLIGALLSMAAVTYYTTPYELVTRLWVIPGALIGVLFPAFSTTLVQDRNRTARLFGRAINNIFLLVFPMALIIVTLSQEGLELWLGPELAQHCTPILKWMAVGVFFNSMAMVPFALIQGAGRPDISAILHLMELPFYLLAVWWLTVNYGIQGTAIAWVARVAVDMVALFIAARWLLPAITTAIGHMAVTFGVALLSLGLGALAVGLMMKGLFLAGVMIIFVPAAWLLLLSNEERGLLKRFLHLDFE